MIGRQTVSVGVSERYPSESLKHWFKRTDAALYQAKQQGRNLVIVSDGNEELPLNTLHVFWESEWESGQKEIDQQHQQLIQTGNQLINASREGASQQELLLGLEQFIAQLVNHYACEETILASCGYPDHEIHASIHNDLLGRALYLKKTFENGELNSAAFFSFMTDDLIFKHLLEEDTKYFAYTRGK